MFTYVPYLLTIKHDYVSCYVDTCMVYSMRKPMGFNKYQGRNQDFEKGGVQDFK